ncbi:unnamed protein product [Boreogadus saida]
MSGGEVIFQGWLRKSPPEKKLRRYRWRVYSGPSRPCPVEEALLQYGPVSTAAWKTTCSHPRPSAFSAL